MAIESWKHGFAAINGIRLHYVEAGGMKHFGEVLAEARKQRGLTLKAVAPRVKKDDGVPMSDAYLNDIELGHKGPPSDFMPSISWPPRTLSRIVPPSATVRPPGPFGDRLCQRSAAQFRAG